MNPAPPSTTARISGHPTVAILEAHHVLELRSRGLEHVAVRERGHAVAQAGGDVERLARREHAPFQRVTLARLQLEPAGEEVDRLVLGAVVLQAERVSRADVEDLADVPVGVRPDQLVTPGLLDAHGLVLGHPEVPQRAGMTTADVRSSRSTSRRKRSADSLSAKAPTRTRYQTPFPGRRASATHALSPTAAARAASWAASAPSCKAPSWTVNLPGSAGGSGSAGGPSGVTATVRAGATLTVVGGGGSSFFAASGRAGAAATVDSAAGFGAAGPGSGTAAALGGALRCACALCSSRATRSPASAGCGDLRAICIPTSSPSANIPASNSNAPTANAATCRSSMVSSIFSRSRRPSILASVPSRAGARPENAAPGARCRRLVPTPPPALFRPPPSAR